MGISLLLCGAGSSQPEPENELLPLPEWSAGEELAPLLGGLLPQDPQALQLRSPETANIPGLGSQLEQAPPLIYPEEPLGLQVGDMGLFLPESLLSLPSSGTSTPLRPPTPTVALETLPIEVVTAIQLAPQDQALVDPLGLLSEMPKAALHRFLDFHSRDAQIDIRVVLMDRHHKLPPSIDWDGASQTEASDRDTCLVAYPLGEPWRARIFLSRKVHEAASRRYLTELASDCVSDAMEVSESQDQLHRFAVRLSTRLFWLENILPVESSLAGDSSALHEIVEASKENPSSWSAGGFSIFGARLMQPLIALIVALTGVATVFVARKRVFNRQPDPSTVYLLPEPTIEPRLGGAFSGGAGVSASFKSP